MWLKWIGVALILTAGFWAGESRQRQWVRQVRLLEELLRFAEFLQIELTWRERLLPDLLREGAEKSCDAALQHFLLFWAQNDTGSNVEMLQTLRMLHLSSEEEHSLRLLYESLGHSTLEEQVRLIQQFSLQQQRLLGERREEGVKFTQLWRYCGIFSAAILAILLI